MNRSASLARSSGHPLRAHWESLCERLEAGIDDTVLALIARFSIAGIFWMSGRTKVDGWLTVSDRAVLLFAEEYRVPLLAPGVAAHMAAWAEHLFPVLLAVGLLTRLSAAALLAMTAVIQIFVYPDAWPTHLSWAGLLALLIARGAGALSLDRALGIR